MQELIQKLQNKEAHLGVLGLGYVGLPLAVSFAKAGFRVTGFDLDQRKVAQVGTAESYIIDISDEELREVVESGRLTATTDFSELKNVDSVNICVPTPLGKTRDPDISYINSAVGSIAENMHAGMLIVLESTTYPGTTEEVILPELEAQGFETAPEVFK